MICWSICVNLPMTLKDKDIKEKKLNLFLKSSSRSLQCFVLKENLNITGHKEVHISQQSVAMNLLKRTQLNKMKNWIWCSPSTFHFQNINQGVVGRIHHQKHININMSSMMTVIHFSLLPRTSMNQMKASLPINDIVYY